MGYNWQQNVEAVQQADNTYAEMQKQSSVIVFDPAKVRIGGGNPARPSRMDFFVDYENCYDKAIEIARVKKADFVQTFGRLLRKRGIVPTKKYFSVVRKRRD